MNRDQVLGRIIRAVIDDKGGNGSPVPNQPDLPVAPNAILTLSTGQQLPVRVDKLEVTIKTDSIVMIRGDIDNSSVKGTVVCLADADAAREFLELCDE